MKDQGQKQQGDVRRAPESGEPLETGRPRETGADAARRGKSPDPGGERMPGRTDERGNVGRVGEDLESGRQDAV
jgi:hypothetical protein